MPDALGCSDEIRGLRVEDVGYEALRVAVVEREKRGLYLDHDAMPWLERVVYVW